MVGIGDKKDDNALRWLVRLRRVRSSVRVCFEKINSITGKIFTHASHRSLQE